jgi:hypothetical protein
VSIWHSPGADIDLTLNRTPDVGRQRIATGYRVIPATACCRPWPRRAVSDAILGQADELALYQGLSNGSFPGGKHLAAPLERSAKPGIDCATAFDESFSGIPVMNKQEEIAALAILIHDLRKHKKFTLKELADRIGRSVGFCLRSSAVCRGRPWPI